MKSFVTLSANGEKTRLALFFTFLKIGLCGFGGVSNWARRIIVEERAWLNEREFAELFGVASILPGANTLNVAVLLGDRYCGVSGSLCALAGLMLMPLAILFCIATLYARFSFELDVKNAVAASAAATAGLTIGTALKMLIGIKPDSLALVSGGIIFVAVGLLQMPMTISLLIVIPLALVLRRAKERRQ